MTSYIWDICYQLCCHSLSNFEPETLPHQCRSSPNPFTSSSSSKVISWEIFSLRLHEKLLLWVAIVFSEKVFFYFGGIRYHMGGDLWWPIEDQCAADLLPLTLYAQYLVPCTSQYLPYGFAPYYTKNSDFCTQPLLLTTSVVLLSPSLVPLVPADVAEAIAVVTEAKLSGWPTKIPNGVNNCWIQNVSFSLLEIVI